MSKPNSPQRGPNRVQERWNIGESVFDVLVGGVSFLDSKEGFRGSFDDGESAERFLNAYGYDLSDPIELAELQGNVQEAIRFIRRYFLKPENPDGLDLDFPKAFNDLNDVRELLLMASSTTNDTLRFWACAVLRVVHSINHVDRDLRTQYFGDIQTQILDRFYRYLHRDEEGTLYIGRNEDDPMRVDLVEFQVKPKKARDSTLMKLLHKANATAEELFDRVGVRFVTKNRVDAIRVIHFLDQEHLIVAANIRPSRSRNTLVDSVYFRDVLRKGVTAAQGSQIDEERLIKDLEQSPFGIPSETENAFTSEYYRAIQFTCRQLIKIRSQLADQLRDLRKQAKKGDPSGEFEEAIKRLDTKSLQRVTRFFYPFEIQIMDEVSYVENEKGRSAHGKYKRAQQEKAMRRVLGGLVEDESHEARG